MNKTSQYLMVFILYVFCTGPVKWVLAHGGVQDPTNIVRMHSFCQPAEWVAEALPGISPMLESYWSI